MPLTPFGTFHTFLSVLTVVLMSVALFRNGRITARTTNGRAYLAGLLATTLTGFPIFRHGGIGPPHILGVITLLTLATAMAAGRGRFGRAAAYVETVCYSSTVLYTMIPTFTETLTRLPAGNPVADGPEAPILKAINAVLITLFLFGASVQVRNLRRADTRLLRAGQSTRIALTQESRA